MNWIKPEFGDSAAIPKKRIRSEDTSNNINSKESKALDKEVLQSFELLTKQSVKNKEDLVINKKKIEEVESWLKSVDEEETYLLITGPPGSGKFTTLNVLCKSIKMDCVEWIPPLATPYDVENLTDYCSELVAFEDFVLRATRYSNVLSSNTRRLVVIKDIPHGFISDTQKLYEALEKFNRVSNVHIVFILSDSSLCHDLFPEKIKLVFSMKTINFNPVTQKAITTGLQKITQKLSTEELKQRGECYIDEISLMCKGDLRNAITRLHFLISKGTIHTPAQMQKKKKTKCSKSKKIISETTSNISTDSKIDIFHGLGRILYAKKDKGKLVHNPIEVANSFSSSPQLFISMLHENYLNTFSSIHDVARVSNSLVTSDHLFRDWNSNSMCLGCGICVACLSLMTQNSKPIKKFQQFNKSQFTKQTLLNEYKKIIESGEPYWKGTDLVLDIAPYAVKVSYNQWNNDILNKLAKFS